MRRRLSKPKPKKLTYELIERDSLAGHPIYALLDDLVAVHHDDLSRTEARIALAWCTSWKPDVDGRVTLGKCMKASDLHRELAPYDFVILLSRSFVEDPLVTVQQRRALLDHELSHAAVKYDATGEPMRDARDRVCFRVRKHDLEEFAAVVARHGCYKRDIEMFASALNRGRQKSPDYFIGIERLRVLLVSLDLDVPRDVIGEWTQQERRETEEWIALRKELAGIESLVSPIDPPAHLAIALTPPETDPQPV